MEVLEPPGADNRATRTHRGWMLEVLLRGGETNQAIACRFVVGTCACKNDVPTLEDQNLQTSEWRIRRAKWKHEKLVTGMHVEPCSNSPPHSGSRGGIDAASVLESDLSGGDEHPPDITSLNA